MLQMLDVLMFQMLDVLIFQMVDVLTNYYQITNDLFRFSLSLLRSKEPVLFVSNWSTFNSLLQALLCLAYLFSEVMYVDFGG